MPDSPAMQTAQQRFDTIYICSHEICDRLQVARSSIVAARKRGMLPEPIVVALGDGAVYLWERAIVAPYLSAWELTLRARRRQLATPELTA